LEGLNEQNRAELERVAADETMPVEKRIRRVRQLYHEADVFDKAERLVDKYQDRAEEIADEVQPDEFRRLLYYLIDTVLDRGEDAPTPTIDIVESNTLLPVVAKP
jgi:geranylgeranyl diphosphate synthase, type II